MMIQKRKSTKGDKFYFYFATGREAGARIATGIFIYARPKTQIEKNHNKEATTHSTQLDHAVPTSTISQLSSGEFAGVIADTPDQPLALKAFHAHLQVDFAAQQAEECTFVPLPEIHPVTPGAIDARFLQIKAEAAAIIDTRLAEMKSSRRQSNLIIPKKRNTNWRTTKR